MAGLWNGTHDPGNAANEKARDRLALRQDGPVTARLGTAIVARSLSNAGLRVDFVDWFFVAIGLTGIIGTIVVMIWMWFG